MVRIRESTVIDASIDQVWHLLRDFNSHHRWHPAIATSQIEDGLPPDTVGAVRNFRLADGGLLREQLIRCSDADKSLSYCLLEAPVPLIDYVAHMKLRPVTDGDRCYLEWHSEFNPPAPDRDAMIALVRDGVYRAGFAALKDWFGGAPQKVKPPPELTPAPRAAQPAAGAIGVFVTRYGGPEVLKPQPISVPTPGAGEVTIAHSHIGVNFIDIHCRTGHFPLVQPPGIAGMEAVGRITATGPGVTEVQVGDRVGYACAPPGAYCSHRTMSANLLLHLPDALPDAVAAASLLRGITASFLLHQVHPVQPGEVVLVHAAAGGVGQILVPWAKALGATVIATASTDDKLRIAQRLGADHLINYRDHDFADAVLDLTGGQGADVILDGVGQSTFAGSVACAAVRGHVVSYGEASGPVGEWDIGSLSSRSLRVSRPNYVHFTSDRAELLTLAGRFFEAIRGGLIPIEQPVLYPLAEASRAHRDFESRRSPGVCVLQV